MLATGGTLALAFGGLIPPLWAVGALVVIAAPTHAGWILRAFRDSNGGAHK